jgi:hypothetical protein
LFLNDILGYTMKIFASVICAAALAGCGADVAITAANTAAMKKQELEAAQQTKAMAQKKIDEAAQAMQKNAEQIGNVDK